jgi:sulfur-carrier protein
MEIQVMVFGQLTEITGAGMVWLTGITDTKGLENLLKEKFPKLTEMKFVIAVNKKIALENTPVSSDSVIVLMPPFSGG